MNQPYWLRDTQTFFAIDKNVKCIVQIKNRGEKLDALLQEGLKC